MIKFVQTSIITYLDVSSQRIDFSFVRSHSCQHIVHVMVPRNVKITMIQGKISLGFVFQLDVFIMFHHKLIGVGILIGMIFLPFIYKLLASRCSVYLIYTFTCVTPAYRYWRSMCVHSRSGTSARFVTTHTSDKGQIVFDITSAVWGHYPFVIWVPQLHNFNIVRQNGIFRRSNPVPIYAFG